MIDQYDELKIRCPRLGHLITFHYCRNEQENTPCRAVFNCWFQRIPVKKFVYEHYDPQTIEALVTPASGKMVSLVELIEKAQRRADKE